MLQPVNHGPGSAFTKTTRNETKSMVWKFFHEGEKENDMICELCPNGKVIRRGQSSTWNLRRHMKIKHADELKGFTEKMLVGGNIMY